MNISFGDFIKIPTTLQAIIWGIAFTMPMFFMDLLVYHKNYFKAQQMYVQVIFSYCFSLSWLVINLFTSLVFSVGIKRQSKASFEQLITWSAVFAVIILVFLHTQLFFRFDVKSIGKFLFHLGSSYVSVNLVLILFSVYFYYRNMRHRKRYGEQREIEFPNDNGGQQI